MTDSPSLKFGKYAGVALPVVPVPYLEFMLSKQDLWPATRAQIEAELARRAASSTDDDTEPARPLVAKIPRAATVEPLPPELQDDEPFEARFVCPSCGRHAKMSGRLEVVK
jgi:hypothetical protein